MREVEDGGGSSGFNFAQLGALYVFAGPRKRTWEEMLKQGSEAITKGSWKATGFGIVVQLDIQDRPGSVWAIYNFYADDDESTERFHIPVVDDLTQKPLSHIGRLYEDCTETFTVAKIADSLKDVTEHPRITFDVHSKKECQIVRVKEYSVSGVGTFKMLTIVCYKVIRRTDWLESKQARHDNKINNRSRAPSLIPGGQGSTICEQATKGAPDEL